MKVKLLKECAHGKAGTVLASPECWRLAFPSKGCVAAPLDEEAAQRIERDIAGTTGATRQRLVDAMSKAGTWPHQSPEKPIEKTRSEPEPAPVVAQEKKTDDRKPDRK